ncbi:MAG TPA: nitrite reductase large subunit NirB, partial [Acidiferrobacteraceae bacterium]|nr:nitrite reductase large subunit NirB [Acidiferrobacteraceae bacterium]
QTAALLGTDRVCAVRFMDGREVDADLVVMAAGIRPDIDLARAAGLYCERGVVVNDTLQTFDPRIYAVGECVQHRRETYGLVAPLFEQAKVCANHLAALGYGMYRGSVTATRLKVTGVDLFSMGRFMAGPGDEEIVFQDAGQGVYKKLVLCDNRIAGGVLFGDAADSSWYFDLMRQNADVAALRPHLLFGPAVASGDTADVLVLKDDAEICGCNGVSKGTILRAIQTQNLKTLDEVRLCTKASSSCGSCSKLVERLLAGTVQDYAAPTQTALCRCTHHSSDAVREAVQNTPVSTVREVMQALEWRTTEGCSTCRPAINYYLLSTYPQTYRDDSRSRLVNERLHANIQQDGTYSVVPRMWGGMTSARELRAIADVVDKFQVPAVKITGGQRIDLLGIQREQLPAVWADLNAAGMVSGHAYGKAMRTVKTCVGKEWCRYGTQDSTALGVRLEQMTWGCWTPHKFKMAVSACPRNCAEVTIKDFGVIGVESGWDIHVGGNAGVTLRATDLLVHVTQADEVLQYCAAYLQLYREQARYLERTAPWIERVGIDRIRASLVEDASGRAALAGRFAESQSYSQSDPWADRVAGTNDFSTVQPLVEVPDVS